MVRLKAREIPKGHVACGTSGVAVNVGANADRAYRAEAARQRWLWNEFLAINIETHRALGKFIFYHEMARRLTHMRAASAWLGAGGVAAQQATLRALERALKDSFPSAKIRRGFPRFKKAENRTDAISIPAAKLGLVRDGEGVVTHVSLPKLPLLRVRNVFVPRGARITTATVAMSGDGWRVSLGLVAPPKSAPEPVVESLGVDIGLTVLATAASADLSLVIEADNPRPLRKALTRLRRQSRTLSRRTKGSVGRRRAARAVARTHRCVANLRRGHHHRASRRIVDVARHVSVETLSVKGLMQTRMARSVADAAPGGFLRMLEYKAAWAGRGFAALGRWQRSTGCCPDCGLIGPRLELRQRTWTCGGCGERHERDLAAARYIDLVGRRSPEPGLDEPAPKRGPAGTCGGGACARSSRTGPPANVPHEKTHAQRASAG